MPACASASVATLTTRLSTVSVSNFPNGVCAQPTMLAVMVVLPELAGVVVAYIEAGFSDFMARSHMAGMPAQLSGPISAVRHHQETPNPNNVGFAHPEATVGFPMSAV